MAVKIYHGDILFTPSADRLEIHENSYIIVEDGVVSQICEKIPEQYQGAEVVDYGDKLIIPAFSDLHVHGAQYVQRGIGMDCLLSDWLNHYTFPQESRFQNMEYAKNCYDAFVDDMLRHGTFHANVFATIHREATNYLFDKMEEKGMYGYVGKVNMDCNSPEFLTETTEDSLKETEKYLAEHEGSKKVKTILAPRFAPTCSKPLIDGLGKLAAKYHCGVHTHLVESLWEAQEALNLFPGYGSDAEIYERAGLMDHGPSIFAHVIFPTEEDKRILKKHGSFSVHCPDATVNIIAGIMPLQHMEDPWTKMTAEEKLERFCYIGDDRNIKARYIDGELLEQEF